MPDLRTRIAAVVAAHRDQCGDCSCGWESWEESWDMHLTDAVIRELDMFKEDGECSYCHAQLPGCRYICDWRTDD